MGIMLFAHMVTFIAVTYFDQMIVFWYLLLAMISTVNDLSQAILNSTGNTTTGIQDG